MLWWSTTRSRYAAARCGRAAVARIGRPSNRSEAEVPLEGESGRHDERGLRGEDQPYDQGCFKHCHSTHEPRAI